MSSFKLFVCKGFDEQGCGDRLLSELELLDLKDPTHLRDFIHLVRIGDLARIKTQRVRLLVKQKYAELFESMIMCNLGALLGLLSEEKAVVAGDLGIKLESLIRRVYEQAMYEVRLPSKSNCFAEILRHLVVSGTGSGLLPRLPFGPGSLLDQKSEESRTRK
jgi:hypothetical protein